MSAYLFASAAKVTETLGVLGASSIASTQQTLLQQILVACGASGGTPTAPSTPTGFTATPNNQFTTLSWDAQPEANTFTINYGLTNDFGASTQLTASATGTTFTHSAGTGLVVGERYYYWIQAANMVGESSFTSSVAARSFVTVANGGSVTLTTPTGSWSLLSLFFGYAPGPPLPDFLNVIAGIGTYFTLGGEWLDSNTEEPSDSVSISGSFIFTNNSGATFTFWNGEP